VSVPSLSPSPPSPSPSTSVAPLPDGHNLQPTGAYQPPADRHDDWPFWLLRPSAAHLSDNKRGVLKSFRLGPPQKRRPTAMTGQERLTSCNSRSEGHHRRSVERASPGRPSPRFHVLRRCRVERGQALDRHGDSQLERPSGVVDCRNLVAHGFDDDRGAPNEVLV
jgi:hypothetical protein